MSYLPPYDPEFDPNGVVLALRQRRAEWDRVHGKQTNASNEKTNEAIEMKKQGIAASHAFSLLVASIRTEHPHLTRQQAVRLASKRAPALHQEFIKATNPSAAWPKT